MSIKKFLFPSLLVCAVLALTLQLFAKPAVGITKHNGGFEATDDLLSLCHVEDARQAGR